MADPMRGPGFVVFTICWLAFQGFIMYTITTAAQEQAGPAAAMVALAATGVVLVCAYFGIVLAARAVMEKAKREQQRDRHTGDDT
jgi:hypothetical protein